MKSLLLRIPVMVWLIALPCSAASYTMTVPAGLSSIANHLDNGGNTLDEVLPVVPDGTILYKWGCIGYVQYTYDSFTPGWSPAGGKLAPGEGAFISNPGSSFNLTFNGTFHFPVLPPSMPCGCGNLNLVSRQVTNSPSTYEDIIGSPPEEGTKVFQWTGSSFALITFAGGVWSPSAPSVNMGEAVFVQIPCCLQVVCPTNKTVDCTNGWTFDTPMVIANCCSNLTTTILSAATNGSCPWVVTRVWELSTFSLLSNDCPAVVITCTQTVTVVDTTPPVFNCVSNRTVDCDETWAFIQPFVTDACSSVNVTVMSTVTNGTGPKFITRVWKGTDGCNNSSYCSQTVTVLTNCCLAVSNECVCCDSVGTYSYSFDLFNNSGETVDVVSFAPTNGNITFNPPSIPLSPPLPPGGTRRIDVTIYATNCGEACFYIELRRASLDLICRRIWCTTLPDCCAPRTYTTSTDFNTGSLLNLTNANDRLCFPLHNEPFPYVNMACSARGTIVRIDANTGQVVAEYRTGPSADYPGGSNPNPSRTTVDVFGNVWVANRTDAILGPTGTAGSVTRFALIIGGTRVNADGSPNPAGQYLKPPFIYNSGAVDRDHDGLIKTSSGLGNILPWPGPEPVNGAVSTAQDECIINYTHVQGSGVRTIALDRNNDVWVGGLNNKVHQKLDGFTAAPVPGTTFTGQAAPFLPGGYGGLIDCNNVLWSISGGGLLRLDLNTFSCTTGCGINLGLYCGSYGIAADPCTGDIWTGSNDKLFRHDLNGNCLTPGGIVTLPSAFLQGIAVDDRGNVWAAHGLTGNSVGRLPTSGVGGVVIPLPGAFNGPTGVAIDHKGKIWVACVNSDKAMRIDPALNAVDLQVDLDAAGNGPAGPYNYSDMTGFSVLSVTRASGSWDFIHEACSDDTRWGVLSWNASPITAVKVEVRADNDVLKLPTKRFQQVTNDIPFCDLNIIGRHLEIRVSLTEPCYCYTNPVCLEDLTVRCCNAPCFSNSAPVVTIIPPDPVCELIPIYMEIPTLMARKSPLFIQVGFYVNNSNVFNTNLPPTSSPCGGNEIILFPHIFPVGSNWVQVIANDGIHPPSSSSAAVIVGDIAAPQWPFVGRTFTNAFSGVLPAFNNGAIDNCAATNQIVYGQTPAPGLVLTQGTYMVTVNASDPAGNTNHNTVAFQVGPVLNLATPKEYATFLTTTGMPATVTIASNVTGVARVNYYLSGQLAATSTNPPFGASITNPIPGTFTVEAEAISIGGLGSRTSPLTVFFATNGPARLDYVVTPIGIVLSWQGTWMLQTSDEAIGPWNDIIGATSPHTVSPIVSRRFYRLRK